MNKAIRTIEAIRMIKASKKSEGSRMSETSKISEASKMSEVSKMSKASKVGPNWHKYCQQTRHALTNTVRTVFENPRKSLIQHCKQSERRLHFEWTEPLV